MKKYLLLFLLLTFWSTKAQFLDDLEHQLSIRYGHISGKGVKDKKLLLMGIDFLLPINLEEFYIGGKLSFATNITREEKQKMVFVYPEITLHKYFNEKGFRPYAQAGVSWASSSLLMGIKPQIMLLELDLSMGYHLPFYKDATERVPFLPRGFQFIIGFSIPFKILD